MLEIEKHLKDFSIFLGENAEHVELETISDQHFTELCRSIDKHRDLSSQFSWKVMCEKERRIRQIRKEKENVNTIHNMKDLLSYIKSFSNKIKDIRKREIEAKKMYRGARKKGAFDFSNDTVGGLMNVETLLESHIRKLTSIKDLLREYQQDSGRGSGNTGIGSSSLAMLSEEGN